MGGRGAVVGHVAAMVRKNALTWARSQIGSKDYARFEKLGEWKKNSFKCNAFVIRAFNHNIIPPVINSRPNPKTLGITYIPYRAKDFYDGKVPGFKRVSSPLPGDVVSDGRHVGIVSGIGKTISASSKTNTVVENQWGFFEKKYRYYRYTGHDD